MSNNDWCTMHIGSLYKNNWMFTVFYAIFHGDCKTNILCTIKAVAHGIYVATSIIAHGIRAQQALLCIDSMRDKHYWSWIPGATSIFVHLFDAQQALLRMYSMYNKHYCTLIPCATWIVAHWFHGQQALLGMGSKRNKHCCALIPCATSIIAHRFHVQQALLCIDSMHNKHCGTWIPCATSLVAHKIWAGHHTTLIIIPSLFLEKGHHISIRVDPGGTPVLSRKTPNRKISCYGTGNF